jgi:hypothetical protein
MKPIDQITKEELLALLELSLGSDFEMDAYDASKLKNAAHQIIYKNIYQKLDGLRTQAERFVDEKMALYTKAIAMYNAELEMDNFT